jgi:hypothetical protein
MRWILPNGDFMSTVKHVGIFDRIWYSFGPISQLRQDPCSSLSFYAPYKKYAGLQGTRRDRTLYKIAACVRDILTTENTAHPYREKCARTTPRTFPAFYLPNSIFQPSDHFHAWPGKHILFMRGIDQLAAKILPGEVQVFVHVQPPLRAIGHVVNDPEVRDEFA